MTRRGTVKDAGVHVFEMGRLDQEHRRQLSLLGRLRALAHGYEQAFGVRADQCHACGLCVAACPEKAIRLARPGGTT